MLNMPPDNEEPSSTNEISSAPEKNREQRGLVAWIKKLVKNKPDTSIRETLEEYIEVTDNHETEDSITAHERDLLSNILKLKDITAFQVMVPRADIAALNVETPQNELLQILSEKPVSRLPVYKDNLDNVIGTVHIKDILGALAKKQKVKLADLVTEVPIISPSMPILDLVLKMRESRRHMALVVDEFGGIDGLVTIGDIIESIVGEIDDEHDEDEAPVLQEKEDGSVTADARMDVEEFEDRFGTLLSEEEREESDTLGGLVTFIAGRVPARGEVLTHDTGMVFEVLDADPRRINRLRIRNIPKHAE